MILDQKRLTHHEDEKRHTVVHLPDLTENYVETEIKLNDITERNTFYLLSTTS